MCTRGCWCGVCGVWDSGSAEYTVHSTVQYISSKNCRSSVALLYSIHILYSIYSTTVYSTLYITGTTHSVYTDEYTVHSTPYCTLLLYSSVYSITVVRIQRVSTIIHWGYTTTRRATTTESFFGWWWPNTTPLPEHSRRRANEGRERLIFLFNVNR